MCVFQDFSSRITSPSFSSVIYTGCIATRFANSGNWEEERVTVGREAPVYASVWTFRLPVGLFSISDFIVGLDLPLCQECPPD